VQDLRIRLHGLSWIGDDREVFIIDIDRRARPGSRLFVFGNDNGDLCGRDQRVIQAAVDTVARMGGGTVRLLPGTFRLRNAVYLCSNLRLIGSATRTTSSS
jgi:polygalacturonase